MKYTAGIIFLLLFCSCALFNQDKGLNSMPDLEFRCDGIRPDCLTPNKAGPGNCLRAGGVWINEAVAVSMKKVEKLGGVFFNMDKAGEGAGKVAYNFPKEDKDRKAPAMTLYYKYGKTSGVQLFGDKNALDLSFSSIRLGDSEETVAKVMCKPRKIEAVKDTGGYVWDYYPVQISIEFIKGKVYSVKIGDCK
jgi:hypothetical protein